MCLGTSDFLIGSVIGIDHPVTTAKGPGADYPVLKITSEKPPFSHLISQGGAR